jgi:NAD(P)H-nitrite reductase large subunit
MSEKTDKLDKGAVLQRDRETYAIVPHIPGGIILDIGMLRKFADVAEKYEAKALKLTSAQRIAIVGINEDKIDAAWEDLGMDKGAAVGMCVRSVRICPAMTFCKRAQQDGVPLGLEIDKKYHGAEFPGKVKISVSGCPNSCAESLVRDIGLVGLKNGYRVYIGGSASSHARVGNLLTENVAQDDVMPLLEKIFDYYTKNARKHERIGMMIDRLGFENVKQGILG